MFRFILRYFHDIEIAVESIVSNKLKSMLTALGIIFGVAAVIAMLAIGKGAKQEIMELNQRGLVIFPRAQDALHEHAQSALMTVEPRFRLFGFLPTDCNLSRHEHDWVRATFGFQEVTIPRHGFVTRLPEKDQPDLPAHPD